MSEQENIQLFHRIIDALNAQDLERLRTLIDDSHVMASDTLPESINGLEAWVQTMQGYFTAFPDLHFAIEQVFASGDYATLRWRATATHQGELMGIPATNR